MQRSTPIEASATVLSLALVLLAGGCERPGDPVPTDLQPRIVSLSPALSRTLVDFNLDGRLVGRSAFCLSVDQRIPVVGDLYEVDYERLVRLRPTHVLVQPPSGGLDAGLERLAGEYGWTIGQWTINSIDDIEQTIRDLPATLYSQGEPARADASGRATELLNEIAASLAPGTETLWGGTTLLIASADPVLAVGRDTYLDDILAALGGRNAVQAVGWLELSLEDVIRLDPEAIIIVRDHGPAVEAVDAAGPLGDLDTTARRRGRIVVLQHPDANLPSSGVIGLAGEMRRVLRRLAEPS